MRKAALLSTGLVLAVLTSCIVSDQFTTLTIRPDGTADWVELRSNIRSTKEGAAAREELERFVEDFEARRGPDFQRLREAGGVILDSRWVRRQAPYATVVTARLPSEESLERLLTFKGDQGETIVEADFQKDGHRRRLSLQVDVPPDKLQSMAPELTAQEWRRRRADNLSEMRLAVEDGKITASQGFAIARDGRSALLDLAEVFELVRQGEGEAELYLEWELTQN